MRSCVATCAHRRFVRDYQGERWRQEQVRDDITKGHATEISLYEEDLITFKAWLIDHKAPSPDDATVEPTPDDWEPPAGF